MSSKCRQFCLSLTVEEGSKPCKIIIFVSVPGENNYHRWRCKRLFLRESCKHVQVTAQCDVISRPVSQFCDMESVARRNLPILKCNSWNFDDLIPLLWMNDLLAPLLTKFYNSCVAISSHQKCSNLHYWPPRSLEYTLQCREIIQLGCTITCKVHVNCWPFWCWSRNIPGE